MSPEPDVGMRDGEKTRLCPTCRMAISVLATKCRFCGENVGRPQEATRSLSVSDLGGETVRHYAPSSNVMDALETFRAEETNTLTPPETKREKTLFGLRAKKPEGDGKPQQNTFGLPELDARSQDLASVSIGSSTVRKTIKKATPPWVNWIKTGLKGAAALAVLFVVLRYGVPAVQDMLKREEIQPNVVNEAVALIERNAAPLEILEAAVVAHKRQASTDNASIAAKAREIVKTRVNAVLNAPAYSRSKLVAAQQMAHRASEIDSSPDMLQLKKDADEEFRAYSLVFLGTREEDGTKKAIFEVQVALREKQEVAAAVGELIDGRFRVEGFPANKCRITDTVKNRRGIECPLKLPVE